VDAEVGCKEVVFLGLVQEFPGFFCSLLFQEHFEEDVGVDE